MECFNCNVSGDKVMLFDAISGKGIVKICEKCSSEERWPIVRKPTIFQLKESVKKYSVYERLSRSSGIVQKEESLRKRELEKIEKTLKEEADKNYEQKIQSKQEPRSDLIDNFHWIIMRARRLKKLTQEQLAKEISEPEAAIKIAEKGIVPEGYSLVTKLENFLGIKIVKGESVRKHEEESDESKFEDSREVSFDTSIVKNLTIDDLKKMKEEREAKILGSFEEGEEDEPKAL